MGIQPQVGTVNDTDSCVLQKPHCGKHDEATRLVFDGLLDGQSYYQIIESLYHNWHKQFPWITNAIPTEEIKGSMLIHVQEFVNDHGNHTEDFTQEDLWQEILFSFMQDIEEELEKCQVTTLLKIDPDEDSRDIIIQLDELVKLSNDGQLNPMECPGCLLGLRCQEEYTKIDQPKCLLKMQYPEIFRRTAEQNSVSWSNPQSPQLVKG